MPPSAITVWALPSSDLVTSATEQPIADASMAARRPAPPAPMTSTSCSWVSIDSMGSPRRCARLRLVEGQVEEVLEGHEHRVADHAHRAHAHVEVGEAHREQADPRPAHVVLVEPADHAPRLLARPTGHGA